MPIERGAMKEPRLYIAFSSPPLLSAPRLYDACPALPCTHTHTLCNRPLEHPTEKQGMENGEKRRQ